MANKTENVYEERIVAFIDILGMKDIIAKNSPPSLALKEIFEKTAKTNDVKKVLDNVNKAFSRQHLGQESPIQISISSIKSRNFSTFSDSIVISYLAGGVLDFLSLIIDVANLQCLLLESGILTRGGITVGFLYHKDDIIFGQALINAYQVENKNAIYPRVILDDKFLEFINKRSMSFSKEISAQAESEIKKKEDKKPKFGRGGLLKQTKDMLSCYVNNLLIKEEDGMHYIDYLFVDFLSSGNNKLRNSAIKLANTEVKKQRRIKKNRNISIAQKYCWLANYASKDKRLYYPKSPFSKKAKTVKVSAIIDVGNNENDNKD